MSDTQKHLTETICKTSDRMYIRQTEMSRNCPKVSEVGVSVEAVRMLCWMTSKKVFQTDETLEIIYNLSLVHPEVKDCYL